jgi:tetratricopeptide (TPR) repeat protein
MLLVFSLLPLSLFAQSTVRGLVTEQNSGNRPVADIRAEMADCCARLARYLILSRQFDEAERFARQSLTLSGNDRRKTKNLAHSLLLQGKYDEAAGLYLALRDVAVTRDATNTWNDIILGDLNEFERAGVTHPDVARIRALFTGTQDPQK